MYKLLQLAYATQLTALDYPNYYFHFALFIPVCAAIRLARFNSENVNNTYFTGLPTPASALFIISIPLIMMSNNEIANELSSNTLYFYGIILVLGILMISNIKLFSLKIKKIQIKGNKLKLSMIIIALILFAFLKYLSIPIIILTYITLSLTLYKTNKDEL
jgi:CDP-diacylglycerol--serine O-phosphatidyltransferase